MAHQRKSLCLSLLLLAVFAGFLPGIGLADQTWSCVDGGAAQGLNIGASSDAISIATAAFSDNLYVMWREQADISRIYIKRHSIRDNQWYPAGISSAELYHQLPQAGSSTTDGWNGVLPALAVYNNTLYAAWMEQKKYYISGISAPYFSDYIRVYRYNGSGWEMASAAGLGDGSYINKNPDGRSIQKISLAVCGNYLYAAWDENWNEKYRVRVSRFDGTHWSELDTKGNADDNDDGLNYDSAKDAKYPSLASWGDQLYATWEELGATGKSLLRLKSFNGSNWSSANDIGGLNYSPANYGVEAGSSSLTVYNGALYGFWTEASHPYEGFYYPQVRVRYYSGSGWSWADGGDSSGWNHDPTVGATNPQAITHHNRLYCVWGEIDSENFLHSQIRAAVYGGASRALIDGGGPYGINYQTAQNAVKPILSVYQGELYVAWLEESAINQKKVRVYKTQLAPTLAAAATGSVSATRATITGSVTYSSGGSVSVYGVQYKKHSDATYTTASNLSGTSGSFSATLTGLSPSTAYDLRTFATNPLGTSYGDPVTFTTAALTMSLAGTLFEAGLNAQSIDVTLSDPIWNDLSLDVSSFTLTGAPSGLTIESITNIDDTRCTVNLAYDGPDFDSDKTGIGLTIAGAEFTTGADLSSSNSLTISAVNDDESITISDDGIYQGTEDGEVITVTLHGGTFASTLNPSSWTVANLPAGVSKGSVTRENKTIVRITLSGNATSAYGSDITNVTVTCPATDYNDSSGGGSLSADTGVVFHAQTPPIVSTESATSITASAATLGGDVISDGGAGIVERGIEWKEASATTYQKESTGGTTGSYSISLTTLNSDTQYDYRAYAVNPRGTSYGAKKSFTTVTIPPLIDRNDRLIIAEDSGAATIAGKLAVADSVQGPSALTLTIGAAPAKGALTKDGTTLGSGSAFTQADIDNDRIKYRPNDNAYGDDSFTFTVSDGAGGTIGATTFNITITAVNDPPVLAKNTGLTVNEDSAATAIDNSSLQATDVDHDAALLVFTVGTAPVKGALTNGGTTLGAGGTFTQADINNGLIKYTPSANANGPDNFTFTVSDGAGGTIGATAFNITITAVNDPPVLAKNTGLTVNEDSAATAIDNSSLQATDVDHDAALLVFTVGTAPVKGALTNGGTALGVGGTFTQADINNGLIKYTPSANANGPDSFTFTVSDGAGGTIGATTFNITITAANDAPIDISLSTTSISENSAIGTTVGTLGATDPDGDTSFTYALVPGTGSTDNASFQISDSNLLINAVFDFETKSSYSIRVRVIDDGGASFEKQFTVTVTNVNDAPVNITLSNSTVAENSTIGTTIGTLSATDPDGDTSFTYTLVPGTGSTDNASFQISGSNLLTNAVLDYETKSSYSIRVRTTDGGGASFEKQFTVTISNLNEAPANITLSKSTVAENSAIGTTIGTLSATDPDGDTSFTYKLVPGTGSTDNASFQISGPNLLTNAMFDFETKSSHSIRVRATDGGGASFEKQFTVTVSNLNEAPANITLSNSTVAENSAIGTTIGTLSATDPDGDTSFTYALVPGTGSTDNASFQISGPNLLTNAMFDFETKSSHSIRVSVTDGGGASFEKQFTVTVSNLNEAPTLVKNSRLTVSVNSAAVSITATLAATDPDHRPDQVIFTLTTAPAKGQLQKSGVALATGGTFTQDDLDNNRIAYRPNSTASGSDSFDFIVSDGAEAKINGSFSISIGSATFAADPTLAESNLNGSVLTVTLDGITFKDNSPAPGNYILNNAPAGLTVQSASNVNSGVCRLTLAFSGVLDNDVANLGLTIRGAELETNADLTASNILSIVNDQTPPRLQTNAGLTLDADSGAVLITQAMLRTVDSEEAAADLTYTIQTAPAKGTLSRSGQPLSAGSAFSQADIDQNLISYTPNGNAGGPDGFGFTVSDGTNGGTINGSFAISIRLYATIAADQTLTGTNLDGRVVTVTLVGAKFISQELAGADFTLNNPPTGLTVQNPAYSDNTHCQVTLAFAGALSVDAVLQLTVKAAALSCAVDLTASNTLAIIDDLPTGKDVIVLQPGGGTSDDNAWHSARSYQNDLWTDWDGAALLLGKGQGNRKSDVWLINSDLIGSGQGQIQPGTVIDRAELILKVKAVSGDQATPRRIAIYAVSDPGNLGQPIFGRTNGLRTGLDFRFRDHRLGRAVPWADNAQNILEMYQLHSIAALDGYELIPQALAESGETTVRLNITAALQAWLSDPANANQGLYLTPDEGWEAGEGIEFYGVTAANTADRPGLRIVYANGISDLTPPPAVTNLTAVATANRVDLSWSNPTGATGVRVLRKYGATPAGPDDGVLVYDGPASALTDQGLVNGKPYYYAAFAYDVYRNYSPKTYIRAVPGDTSAPPSAPADLTVTVSGTVAKLRWTDTSDNELGYLIQRRTESESWTTIETLSTPNRTSYVNSGLQAGAIYYYQISAFNAAGNSALVGAGPVSADNRPLAPANLTWTVISASEVRLQWADTANETSYRIEFMDGNGAPLSGRTAEALPADSTQYSVMRLAPNVGYRFRVVAVNASGEAVSETEPIMTMNDPKLGIF